MNLHPIFQSLLQHSFFGSEYHPNNPKRLFRDGLCEAQHLEVYIIQECWLISFCHEGKLYVAVGLSVPQEAVLGLGSSEIEGPADMLENWLNGAIVFESTISKESVQKLFFQILRRMVHRLMNHFEIHGDMNQFFN